MGTRPDATAVPGLAMITAAIVGVSALVSLLTGGYTHWLFIIGGLAVGWLGAASAGGN